MVNTESKACLFFSALNPDVSVQTSSFVVWGCPDLPPPLPPPRSLQHALPFLHASSPSLAPRGTGGFIRRYRGISCKEVFVIGTVCYSESLGIWTLQSCSFSSALMFYRLYHGSVVCTCKGRQSNLFKVSKLN